MRRSHALVASVVAVASASCTHTHLESPVLRPAAGLETSHVHDRVMHYTLSGIPPRDSVARPVGSRVLEYTVVNDHGQRVLHAVSTVTFAGGAIVDTIVTSLDGLRPISERSVQPTKTMALDFRGRVVTGMVTPRDGKPVPINHQLDRATFNSSDADLILASLPFDRSYTGVFPLYTYEAGGIERYVVDSIRPDAAHVVAQPAWVAYATGPSLVLSVWVDAKTRAVLRHEAFIRANGARSISTLDAPAP